MWVLAGVVLLVAPHLCGAPQPAEYTSAAPEALAHEFVVIATVTSLLFWVVLGTLSGFIFSTMRKSSSNKARIGAFSLGS
jgi:predicted cobalt transporter CbtA